MTTSYQGGTKQGPPAIIEASNQVELYDSEVGSEAAFEYGVYTLPTLHPDLASSQAAVDSITQAVTDLPLEDRLLVTLGGEHSITPGIVAAFAPRYPDLLMVQIDANSDLRYSFDGTPCLHACAMRRCLPYATVLQFGIRSVCQEEVDFARQSDRVKIWTAEAMYRDGERSYLQAVREAVSNRTVYLTIDLIGLDPSIIPATGTPEPGGIGWVNCPGLCRTGAHNTHPTSLAC